MDRIPHAQARCPLTLSAYHVCRSCSPPSVRKLCGVFGRTVSKASQHSTWEQPALHFTPWNTSCRVLTLCQLICLDCIMQSRKLFGNLKLRCQFWPGKTHLHVDGRHHERHIWLSSFSSETGTLIDGKTNTLTSIRSLLASPAQTLLFAAIPMRPNLPVLKGWLNVCFRLPTYREARRHHKAQHAEYPGNSRQASHFCIVQKNRQFSLSAKILQIASCTQKHLAHPDSQRIMCALPGTISPSVRIWETTLVWLSAAVSTSQGIATFGMRTAGTLTCGLQALYTSTKAARKHLWASWIECLFSTANLSRGTEASQSSAWGVPWQLKTSLSLLHSPEKQAVFIVCKNPSDCILHAEAPCPSRLSAYHVCIARDHQSISENLRKLRWPDC